jgi:very-short-patch-repair endonuclease
MRAALRRKAVLLISTPVMSVTPRRTTRRARSLRRAPSEAEKRLWGFLRDRRLNDFKFVRQAPLGPYFADFLCRDRRLIVEVDGVTHGEDHQVAHDARRTRYLESQGYRVLRVWNIEVFTNLDGVLTTILMALETPSGTGR